MPDITPEQALSALMLGTGETELILDPEVVRAVHGVQIEVQWGEFRGDLLNLGSDQPRSLWTLRFKGMPDPRLLEQKGIRIPHVPAGVFLGAKAVHLGDDHPRRDTRPRNVGQQWDPGPQGPKYAD